MQMNPIVPLNFPEFMPKFETERLYMRLLVSQDASSLFALRSNLHAMQYLDRPIAKSVHDAEEMIAMLHKSGSEKSAFQWGVFLKTTSDMIGSIGFYRIDAGNFKTELGYMFFPVFWRQGFATEAAKELLRFGFESIGFHRIEADINPNNEASMLLCEKLGFSKEAHLRQNFYFEGRFTDTVIMGMLKSDWIKPELYLNE